MAPSRTSPSRVSRRTRPTTPPRNIKVHLQVQKERTSFQEETDGFLARNPDGILPNDPRAPPLQLSELSCLRTLGSGTFGRVVVTSVPRKGNKRESTLLAVKIETKRMARTDPNADDEETKDPERRCLVDLPWSPWVSGLVDAFHDPKNLYLALELIPCASLKTLIYDFPNRLTFSSARFYFSNIVCGLDFIHRYSIVHRDLKPENILLGADGYLVLADFGCSKMEHEGLGWALGGTPAYAAPETIESIGRGLPGAVSDWWAAGCILFEMITRRLAFCAEVDFEVWDLVLEGKYKWPEGLRVGARVKDLVSQLLTQPANKRLGYDWSDYKPPAGSDEPGRGAKQVMDHPWLEKMDWKKMRAREYLAPYIPKAPEVIDQWHTQRLPLQHKTPHLRVIEPLELLKYDRRCSPEKALRKQHKLKAKENIQPKRPVD